MTPKPAWPKNETLDLIVDKRGATGRFKAAAARLTGCPASRIRVEYVADSEVESHVRAHACAHWKNWLASYPAHSSQTPYIAAAELWGVDQLVTTEWSEWTWYGVRCCDDDLAVGDKVPASRVWDDGEPTDEMLDGASCLMVAQDGIGPAHILDHLARLSSYVGEHVYLVAGHYASYGEDDGEIVIEDAVVIDVIS